MTSRLTSDTVLLTFSLQRNLSVEHYIRKDGSIWTAFNDAPYHRDLPEDLPPRPSLRTLSPVFHSPNHSYHAFIPLEPIWSSPFLARFNITANQVPIQVPGLQPGEAQTYRMEMSASQSWLRMETALLYVIESVRNFHPNQTLPAMGEIFPKPSEFGYTRAYKTPEILKRCVIRSRNAFLPWLAQISAMYAYFGRDALDTTLLARKVAPAWLDDLYTSVGSMQERRVGCFVRFQDYQPQGRFARSDHSITHQIVEALLRTNAPVHICWGPRAPSYSQQMQLGAVYQKFGSDLKKTSDGPICKWMPNQETVDLLQIPTEANPIGDAARKQHKDKLHPSPKSPSPPPEMDTDMNPGEGLSEGEPRESPLSPSQSSETDIDMSDGEDFYEDKPTASPASRSELPETDADATNDFSDDKLLAAADTIQPAPPDAFDPKKDFPKDVTAYSIAAYALNQRQVVNPSPLGFQCYVDVLRCRMGFDTTRQEEAAASPASLVGLERSLQDNREYSTGDHYRERAYQFIQALQEESPYYFAWPTDMARHKLAFHDDAVTLAQKAKNVKYSIFHSEHISSRISMPILRHCFLLSSKESHYHIMLSDMKRDYAGLVGSPDFAAAREARTTSRACTVAHMLRVAVTLPEVRQHLLAHRIQFQTCFPGHRPPPKTETVVGLGRRDITDVPGYSDYLQYKARLAIFFGLNPRIHQIALAYGGVVAYVANLYRVERAEHATIPPKLPFGAHTANVTIGGKELHYEDLSPHHLALICGVYLVRTQLDRKTQGPEQLAQMSWYPQHLTWYQPRSKWSHTDYLTYSANKVLNDHHAKLESHSEPKLCFTLKEWKDKFRGKAHGSQDTAKMYSSANEATLSYLEDSQCALLLGLLRL